MYLGENVLPFKRRITNAGDINSLHRASVQNRKIGYGPFPVWGLGVFIASTGDLERLGSGARFGAIMIFLPFTVLSGIF